MGRKSTQDGIEGLFKYIRFEITFKRTENLP